MVETLPLPLLRQELGLYPSPPTANGTPSWVLHDPPVNRFFLLGWPAFEILSRWQLGTVPGIAEAVNRETTLSVTNDDILQVVAFLEQNFLVDSITPLASDRLAGARRSRCSNWTSWLLQNYLFFRIPLIRPQSFLDRFAPMVKGLYTRPFLGAVILAALIAAFFISRQWDVFVNSFSAYKSWDGLLMVACTVACAKVIHEFGHAFTAHRYGCRIPIMGLAFVVLTPMMYTDTNEAWKLTSRRQRLAIGVAGLSAELLFSLVAIWAWLILPDGPFKGAAFILATTTWVMSIALNASPFMRFDGYFILSDLLGISNLNTRSFAFGRWWMRELFFGLGDPQPEPSLPARRNFMVIFSYAAWLYRFFLFLGIALLVYYYFFKALGIFLMIVEIGWFILLPICSEVKAWWNLLDRIKINRSTLFSIFFLAALFLILIIPWQGRLAAPAVLSAAREQHVTAPSPATVIAEPAATLHTVRSGDVLIRLSSPDLEQRIRLIRMSMSVSLWQVYQQSFDGLLLNQGNVPKRRVDLVAMELEGLLEERERLTVRAPFDGVIVARNEELTPGLWVAKNELLYLITDKGKNSVNAYVGELFLNRIAIGARARFIPDAPEFGNYECQVTEIDRVNVPFLDEPSLSSLYGGPIASRQFAHGLPLPDVPVFRVRLDGCSPTDVPALKLRGTVHIDVEKRSLLMDAFRYISAVFIREISL